MQAVIALCHFCENHGPRVVMTCQPMRDFGEKDICTPSTSLGPSTSNSPPGPIVPLIKLDGENEPIDQRLVDRPKAVGNEDTAYPHYGNCTKHTIDTEDRCSACSSFRNGPCLLSNDHQTQTSYVSTEVALQDRVYERVKNACMRSLSCEVSAASTKSPVPPPSTTRHNTPRKWHPDVIHEEPMQGTRIPPSAAVLQEPNDDGIFEQPAAEEADGCVIFGDTDNGYCFAYTFRLADAKARGFYRLFSLIVVSNDLTFLTNNFEYFKQSLGGIKNELQRLAQDVFTREIDVGEKLTEDDIHKPEYQKLVGKMPSWYRRKIAIDTDRNLTVVTANEQIWVLLHRLMMWTLRSPTLACRDQVMEGKPTQDMMVLMELDESAIVELELRQPNQHQLVHLPRYSISFVSIYSKMCIASNNGSVASPNQEEMVAVDGQRQIIVEIQNMPPSFMMRVHNEKTETAIATEPDDFEGVENEKMAGKVSMAQLANLKTIAYQLQSCGESGDLETMLYHIVTGGQVAVVSREKMYCRQFLLAISNLLPIGCIKLATYKEHYLPEYSTRFNLIGGPLNMDLPLDFADVMIFRVTPRDPASTDYEKSSLADCVIDVRRRPEKEGWNGMLPQIAKRYRDLLLDADVRDTVLETVLRTTREGWMHKAKICFQMKNQLPASEMFKHITGVYPEDHQVVLYWTAGLSNAYKQHVLATIQQSQASVAAAAAAAALAVSRSATAR
ncbi:unnamed protein product [Caenorhabditis sp. 36 PRJEB53466]|nr:unnamed protein product [Caenorhabditis sp. 36 PRJEB53466]